MRCSRGGTREALETCLGRLADSSSPTLSSPHALQEFQAKEAPIFEQITEQVHQAQEHARVAELKSEEARVEALQLVHTRRDVRAELAVAKACVEKAEKIIGETVELVEKADRTKRELAGATPAPAPSPAESQTLPPLTPAAEEGTAWRLQLSKSLELEAAELERAARERQAHMRELADAADRVERE